MYGYNSVEHMNDNSIRVVVEEDTPITAVEPKCELKGWY